MKQSITQESDYGCGIACFAFVSNINYKRAVDFLGSAQADSDRFFVKHFVAELNRFGGNYSAKHIKPGSTHYYREGTIVLIRRSNRYPVGHYLARHNGQWMDPWVNLLYTKDLSRSQSGFRKRLPGQAMYALIPALG